MDLEKGSLLVDLEMDIPRLIRVWIEIEKAARDVLFCAQNSEFHLTSASKKDLPQLIAFWISWLFEQLI